MIVRADAEAAPVTSVKCFRCNATTLLRRYGGSGPKPTRMWLPVHAPEAVGECRACRTMEHHYEFGQASNDPGFKLAGPTAWKDSPIFQPAKKGSYISERFIYVI